MTFNTKMKSINLGLVKVLNLVINGWPSIPEGYDYSDADRFYEVLNLVINGWPSIHHVMGVNQLDEIHNVLNLVINGWPSILI